VAQAGATFALGREISEVHLFLDGDPIARGAVTPDAVLFDGGLNRGEHELRGTLFGARRVHVRFEERIELTAPLDAEVRLSEEAAVVIRVSPKKTSTP